MSHIYFIGVTLYMFRTVFTAIIRSSRLYILQQAYVKQILPTASSRQYLELMMDGKTVRNMYSVTPIKYI
jgi:hypothetical protein